MPIRGAEYMPTLLGHPIRRRIAADSRIGDFSGAHIAESGTNFELFVSAKSALRVGYRLRSSLRSRLGTNISVRWFGALIRRTDLVPVFLVPSRAPTLPFARVPTQHPHFDARFGALSIRCPCSGNESGSESGTDSAFSRVLTQHPHFGAWFGAPNIRCPCSGTESGTNSTHLLGTRLYTHILAQDSGLRVLGFRVLEPSRARTLACQCPTRCQV